MPSHRAVVALALVALLAATLPAGANHMQSEQGKIIVFDHKESGANEWWVEVILSGQSSGSVLAVDAMDYGGPWVPMQKTSYGSWSASFHIESGNPVKFRAAWSGGALVQSCWFSHPQGAESCGTSPPPPGPAWNATRIGSNGLSHGRTDIAVGQVAGRAGREVFVPGASGLSVFTWTSSGWVGNPVMAGNTGSVAVGELRGGDSSVYVSTYNESANSGMVHMAWWDGVQWASVPIFSVAGAEVTGLTLGDVEEGGPRELYVITGHPHALGNGVGYDAYQLKPNPDGPGIRTTRIATGSGPTFPVAMETLWVGDGDNDGDRELFVGGPEEPSVWRVDAAGAGWSVARHATAGEGNAIVAVTVGDPDRTGGQEVYAVARYTRGQDSVWQMRAAGGAVTTARILLGSSSENMLDMFAADGDSDGRGELYITASGGHLLQLFHDGTQWRPVQLADVKVQPGGSDRLADLAVGDGDNDGRNEAYATGFDFSTTLHPMHNVYRIGTVQPPRPPTGFAASFSNAKGNEWWEEVTVAANAPIDRVSVILNDGAPKPLTLRSWGSWAGSYHAPVGTRVQFVAYEGGGQASASGCYHWTDAEPQACGPSSPAFDATFNGVKGNEWWVQATVGSNQPLAGVDARIGCTGGWIPLTLQSWGGWAKSFHVPNGAKVDLRARSTGGATDLSGGYIWPNATPAAPC